MGEGRFFYIKNKHYFEVQINWEFVKSNKVNPNGENTVPMKLKLFRFLSLENCKN